MMHAWVLVLRTSEPDEDVPDPDSDEELDEVQYVEETIPAVLPEPFAREPGRDAVEVGAGCLPDVDDVVLFGGFEEELLGMLMEDMMDQQDAEQVSGCELAGQFASSSGSGSVMPLPAPVESGIGLLAALKSDAACPSDSAEKDSSGQDIANIAWLLQEGVASESQVREALSADVTASQFDVSEGQPLPDWLIQLSESLPEIDPVQACVSLGEQQPTDPDIVMLLNEGLISMSDVRFAMQEEASATLACEIGAGLGALSSSQDEASAALVYKVEASVGTSSSSSGIKGQSALEVQVFLDGLAALEKESALTLKKMDEEEAKHESEAQKKVLTGGVGTT